MSAVKRLRDGFGALRRLVGPAEDPAGDGGGSVEPRPDAPRSRNPAPAGPVKRARSASASVSPPPSLRRDVALERNGGAVSRVTDVAAASAEVWTRERSESRSESGEGSQSNGSHHPGLMQAMSFFPTQLASLLWRRETTRAPVTHRVRTRVVESVVTPSGAYPSEWEQPGAPLPGPADGGVRRVTAPLPAHAPLVAATPPPGTYRGAGAAGSWPPMDTTPRCLFAALQQSSRETVAATAPAASKEPVERVVRGDRGADREGDAEALTQRLRESLSRVRKQYWSQPVAHGAADDAAESRGGDAVRSSAAAEANAREVYDMVLTALTTRALRTAVRQQLAVIGTVAESCLSTFVRSVVVQELDREVPRLVCRGIRRHLLAGDTVVLARIEADEDDEVVYGRVMALGGAGAAGAGQKVSEPEVAPGTGAGAELGLTYGQLCSLRPGEWLNDQVINAYCQLLSTSSSAVGVAESQRRVVSLGSHFYAKVLQEVPLAEAEHSESRSGAPTAPRRRMSLGRSPAGDEPSLQLEYLVKAKSGVLRWLRRRTHLLRPCATAHLDIFRGETDASADVVVGSDSATPPNLTRTVLMPINHGQTHWAIVVMDYVSCRLYYYDSLAGSARRHGEEVLAMVAHTFCESRRLLLGTDTQPRALGATRVSRPTAGGADDENRDGPCSPRCVLCHCTNALAVGEDGSCTACRSQTGATASAPARPRDADDSVGWVCFCRWGRIVAHSATPITGTDERHATTTNDRATSGASGMNDTWDTVLGADAPRGYRFLRGRNTRIEWFTLYDDQRRHEACTPRVSRQMMPPPARQHSSCSRAVSLASSDHDGFSYGANQTNGHDCGVFVCQFAYCAARERSVDFVQGNIPLLRRVLLHELLLWRILNRLG